MNRRVAVRAIAVRDGKLLCVRLKAYEGALGTSGEGEWWCLPGGSLESNESLVQGIEREMLEETGIAAHIGALLYIQQFAMPDTDTEHLEFFFNILNVDDYVHVDLAKSSHGQIEIAEIAYADPATTSILPEFLTTENLAAKVAGNEPPALFSFLE